MKEITDEEYELFTEMKKIWFHAEPKMTDSFFICAVADESRFPEVILVCPQMGTNTTAVYKRDIDTNQ